MRFLSVATALLALSIAPRGQATCGFQTALFDVPYDTQHAQQVLDFFHPSPAAAAPAPVAIWLPGGFTGLQPPTLDPCQVPLLAAFLSRGFALVLPDIRPSLNNPFPLPVFDGARIVQTVRHHAAAWNIDPQRVFLMARSSGGLVGGGVAYGLDFQGILGTDAVSLQSSRPNAVYLASAVSNVLALANTIEGTYFGQPTLATVPAGAKQYGSPNWWAAVSPSVPIPTYLVYKGAIGTPPLADSHDAWLGLDYGLNLLSRGATVGFQYFPTGIDATSYDAIATWFLALFP
jgi:alpha/beta hydrolase fold